MATALELLTPLVRQFEGFAKVARLKQVPEYEVVQSYLCPAHVWTCGYGSTGPDVTASTVWTREYAEQRNVKDMLMFLNGTLRLCPGVSGARLAALADFAYNLGLGRLQSSTLRKRVLAGNWEEACNELMKWRYGGGKVLAGLDKRRRVEVAMIRSTL